MCQAALRNLDYDRIFDPYTKMTVTEVQVVSCFSKAKNACECCKKVKASCTPPILCGGINLCELLPFIPGSN